MICVSESFVQRVIPVSLCRSSLEADLALWRVTGSFYFSNETGRIAWEVKVRAVLGIMELHCPNIGIENVWSVRV